MMARKKKTTEEFAEDGKDETLSAEPVGTFPKISSETKIKDVSFSEKGPKVHFGKFEVSTGQADFLKRLAESGEKVLITISPIQGRLSGME
jgi:hypothetical protein